MGRIRGAKERPSAKKAAHCRAIAQKRKFRPPLPAGQTREQMLAAVELLRREHPFLAELARQIIHDDLRDERGKPLTEEIWFEGRKLGKRRLHVPVELRTRVMQDLWDRTGLPRQSEHALVGESAVPSFTITIPGFARPGAEQLVSTDSHELPAPASGVH